ncbi:MAG: inositol phosphorylceramide synthase [Jiangellaceae bacterium]|nr:inositol phosphorylceramide synthase [Jiangellaceae bacterium]
MTLQTRDEVSAQPQRSTGRLARALQPWTWPLSRLGLTAYFVVLLVYVVRVGIPLDRIGQTGWILLGILAARLGRPLREHVRAVLDWLPLLAALVLYDHTRGIADSLGIPVRILELVDAERFVFIGTLPTAWLQEHFFDPAQLRWWDAAASLVYVTHFVLPWALAAVLYVRSRPSWVGYVRNVIVLSYAGLATYILLPAAPPWYASGYGYVPEQMDRVATAGWPLLGLRSAGAWLDQAQADSNAVAALPSLHAAFALLVSVTLWTLVRNRVARALIAVYPLAMALTLVYGGEHYFVDVLLGWVYVGATLLTTTWWQRRRSGTAGDPADDVSRPRQVVREDQQPVDLPASGDGAADPRRGERLPDAVELGSGPSSGHRLEQAVVRPRRVDQRGSAGEPPSDHEQ